MMTKIAVSCMIASCVALVGCSGGGEPEGVATTPVEAIAGVTQEQFDGVLEAVTDGLLQEWPGKIYGVSGSPSNESLSILVDEELNSVDVTEKAEELLENVEYGDRYGVEVNFPNLGE